MNIDQQLEQLSHLQYPRQVNVVDNVMAQVMQRPYLQPVHRRNTWRIVSTVAAAAVALLFVVSLTLPYLRSYDDEGLGSMMAQANDFSSWNTIEEAAVNPYEFIYDE